MKKLFALGWLLLAPLAFGADQAYKVFAPAQPAAAALAGTEPIVTVQSAATVKTTPAALSTYVESQLTSADVIGKWTGTCDLTTFLRGDGACAAVTAVPGGADTNVQFNNSGVLDGNSDFTYDGLTLSFSGTAFHSPFIGSQSGPFSITINDDPELTINSNGSWDIESSGTGASGNVLLSTGSGAHPGWAAINLVNTNSVTGTLAVGNGGLGATGLSGVLHGNNTSPVSASAVVLTSEVTGTLPVGNGGTGLTAGTSGGIPYYSASNTLASSAALTANRLVLGGGAGVAPAVLGSLGTTTTLLHGNAAGAPTFAAASLTADVSGTLPIANGGTNLTAATDDQTMIGNGTTWQSKAIPLCGDSTHALAYDTSTNAFACQAITGSGTAPGGSTTQVQFNLSSAFAGDAGFTYVGSTTQALTLGTAANAGTLKGAPGAGGTGAALSAIGGAGAGTGNGGALNLQGGTSANSGGATSGDVNIIAGIINGGNGGRIIMNTGANTERFRILANGAWSVGSAGSDTGTSGQVLKSQGSAAVPVWAGVPPAGSDTQIQFNDASALAGDAGFAYAKTTDTLTLGETGVTPHISGWAGSASASGSLIVETLVGPAGQPSGDMTIKTGAGGSSSSAAGSIAITAGNGGASNGNGGPITITSGNSPGTGTGGNVTITASTTTGGTNGTVALVAGGQNVFSSAGTTVSIGNATNNPATTFLGSGTVTTGSGTTQSNGSIRINSSLPELRMIETDQGTDLKNWTQQVSGSTWSLATQTDAGGAGNNALSFTRTPTTTLAAMNFGNATNNNTFSFLGSGSVTLGGAYISGGTKFTASGCSNSTTVGGATAGKMTSGTTGVCTITITLPTAPTDWNCMASNATTPANPIIQTDTTAHTTSCTISGTTVTGDILRFTAVGY